jgi:catalase
VNTAQGFYDQLVASRPDPETHKPDPLAVKAFLAAHPETVLAMNIIRSHPFAADFANSTFNSLNAFRFLDAAGHVTPVRWAMVPEDHFVPEAAVPPKGANYLFDQLIARIDKGPARWRLIVTLGQPGDPTRDATQQWQNDRKKIDAGTLTVATIASEATGNCRDINFDPLVLPAGIAPSDDPLLSARSAAYAVSFTRRAGEAKMPSAVQLATGSVH